MQIEPSLSTSYRYTPLGWSRMLYGPMFLLFGFGFLTVFVSELQHRRANGGLSTEPFDLVLWAGFLLVPVIFLVSGIAMIQSDRRSWIEDGAWRTARGEFPMFHRRMTKDDVRGYFVANVPAIAVFGNRASVIGNRFHVQALLSNGRRVAIAWFADRPSAKSVAGRFEREVGSKPKETAIGFDATPWYLSGSQSQEYKTMRGNKSAAALYDALCDVWETSYADLRPSGGPSYTESNEAFPYRGSLSVDLDLLRYSYDLQQFDRALRTLVTAGLVDLPKNS